MYPLNTPQPWAINQWYIAGFSAELSEAPIARTYLDRRVVLFRDSMGNAHALSGICPHRMMPMERGRVDGDRLVCGYHGLAFDLQGRCAEAPTSGTAPDCALERFVLREVATLLWIWIGDPGLADGTPLPDQFACHVGEAGWLTQCVDYQLLRARYMLLVDNLFDLSHLGFVHASIVGPGGIALLPTQIEDRQDRIVVTRTMADVPADDYHRFLFPNIGDRITTRLESEQIGHSLINAGGPVFDGSSTTSPILGHQNFVHGVTPATRTTTHYWIMMTRDFRQDDEALSAALAAQNKAVVAQDIDVLESIEDILQSGVDLPKEVSMKSDFGALRVRSRMIQLLRSA